MSDTKFYKKLDHNPTNIYKEEINQFLSKMHDKGEISTDVFNYLFNKECRTSILYYLPKLHKRVGNHIPGRPIVSAIQSATEKISQLLDHFLYPCATRNKSYVKDTTHFLTILDQINIVPANTWLVSLDVVSLYTIGPSS